MTMCMMFIRLNININTIIGGREKKEIRIKKKEEKKRNKEK